MARRHLHRLTVWCGLLASLVVSFAHAELSVRLSNRSLEELETVRMVIRASGTRQSETLDLTALEQDFHVMGTNTSSQYQYVNGREQSWVDYQITLQPKRTGRLLIPGIQVGRERTQPQTLTVRPLADSTRAAIDDLVFFETDVSSETVYVQAELIFTRRLFYSGGVQLYGSQPGAPKIKDAVVIPLGESRATSIQRNGRPYGVVEQRFAIFAETSGTLEIPSVSITASVQLVSNGRSSRKGVRVSTPEQKVTILPVPPSYPPDAPWLPATSVKLLQSFEPSLGRVQQVGDTVRRDVRAVIHGNAGSIVPELLASTDSDALRLYPESPVLDDDSSGSTVVGQRIETMAIVPLQPGNLPLPDIALTWWNTATQTVEVTRLPMQVIIAEGASVNEVIESGTKTAAANEPSSDKPRPLADAATTDMVVRAQPVGLYWLIGGFGLLAASVWLWRLRRTPSNGEAPRQASLKQLKKRLANALEDASPGAIREALIDLISAQFEIPKHRSMRYLGDFSGAGRQLVNDLNACCYQTDDAATAGQSLSLAFATDLNQALRAMQDAQSATDKASAVALPALYSSR